MIFFCSAASGYKKMKLLGYKYVMMMCECLEILSGFLSIADLARIVQEYVHYPRILSEYVSDGFELYARFSKNREIGGLRVSTYAPWIFSGLKHMPYAEISITPWMELYHPGDSRPSTTDSRIILTYVENENQQYISMPMRIRFANNHRFMDELFVPDGYDRFIKSFESWYSFDQCAYVLSTPDLSLEFREVYDAITNELRSIKKCILHTGVSMFICISS